ncbi:hypothetical protein BJX64DRAFT_218337 [Aspergillus heterothallicus]
MSGLNPFRPKKPEGEDIHSAASESAAIVVLRRFRDRLTAVDLAKHSPSQTTPSLSIAPDPIFLGSPSTATTAASKPDLSAANSSAGTTPPPPLDAPNPDDLVTSDDQSTSDPFARENVASDDEVEGLQALPKASTIAPPDDLSLPQETIRFTPPSVSSLDNHTATTSSRENSARQVYEKHNDSNGRSRDRTTSASSFASNRSSSSSNASDSDSAVDEPQRQTTTRTTRRPVSLGPGIDLKSLNNRLANRDRIPPPPPKSHHGKRISTGPSIVLPPSQTTPGKAANRVSFHGSSPGSLPSPRTLQTTQDYFSAPSQTNQPVPLNGIPRRSQSQNKRPPTPPLSRRHSQMRRSKSTLTKPTTSLSIPLAEAEGVASTPSSPGSQLLTPLQRREPNHVSSYPDETQLLSTASLENTSPPPFVPHKDIGLGIQPIPQTTSKRASLVNQLPPPPPPRRARGSKHGDENKDAHRTASLRSAQRADGTENFVPHPSNAKDILADLTRLQKEVDDLRGHYENKKP